MSGCQMKYNMQDGHPKRGKRGSCHLTQFPQNFLVLQWDYDNGWIKRAIQRRCSKLDIKLKPKPMWSDLTGALRYSRLNLTEPEKFLFPV